MHLKKALLKKKAAGAGLSTALGAAKKAGPVSKTLGTAYKGDAVRHAVDPMHMAHVAASDPLSIPSQVYHGAELVEMGHKAAPHLASAARAGGRHAFNTAARVAPTFTTAATRAAPYAGRAIGAVGRTAGRMAPRLAQAGQAASPYLRAALQKAAPAATKAATRLAPTAVNIGGKLVPAAGAAGRGLATAAHKVAPWAWAGSMVADAGGMYLKDPETGKISMKNMGQKLRKNVESEAARANRMLAENQKRYGKVLGTMEGTAGNAIRGFTNPGRTTVTAAQLAEDTAGQSAQALRKLGPGQFAKTMLSKGVNIPAPKINSAVSDKRTVSPKQRFIWEGGMRKANPNYRG